jgi:hypothetical protein
MSHGKKVKNRRLENCRPFTDKNVNECLVTAVNLVMSLMKLSGILGYPEIRTDWRKNRYGRSIPGREEFKQ